MDDKPLDAATAHAAPLTLTIGGKQYKAGRVTVQDLAALKERIRDRRRDAVLRTLPLLRSQEMAAKVLADVLTRDPTDKDLWEAMLSTEGGVFLTWCAVVKHHAEVTEADVWRWASEDKQLTDTVLAESRLITTGTPKAADAADPTLPPPATGSGTP